MKSIKTDELIKHHERMLELCELLKRFEARRERVAYYAKNYEGDYFWKRLHDKCVHELEIIDMAIKRIVRKYIIESNQNLELCL